MPVSPLAGTPDDVARTDLGPGTPLALGPADTLGDDEGLAQGVRMPVGAGARLEGDDGPADPGGGFGGEGAVDAHGAREGVRRALPRRSFAVSLDLHGSALLGA